jgi:hypothetical protein
MKKKRSIPKTSMSDAKVQAATGKTWPQWFKILDKFPKDKTHKERAEWLWDNHLQKGWWVQMVVVVYEQARGLRQVHETAGGFQVSASKTLPIPIGKLYSWWTTKRSSWLDAKGIVVTSATKNKYVHLEMADGTKVDVGFYAKAKGRSIVAVEHRKLKSAAASKKMKVWWGGQLELLSDRILK